MKTTVWLSMILLGALAGCKDSPGDEPSPTAPNAGSDATAQGGAGSAAAASGAGGAGDTSGAASAAGASGAGSASDAGDASVADASGESPFKGCTGELPVMQARDLNKNMEMDADWSCRGAELGPAGGPVRNVRFRFPWPGETIPAAAIALFADVTVDFYFGPSTLGTPALSRTFDGVMEDVQLEVPADLEFLSARIQGPANILPAFTPEEINEYGLVVAHQDNVTIEGYFMVSDSRSLAINQALGGVGGEDPSKALIIALLRDCQERPVSGALFELVDGDTGEVVQTGTEPGMPRVSYSHLGLPSTGCTFSSNQQQVSQFMLIDAPVNVVDGVKTHSYRLRFKGRKTASDAEPVVLNEREVEMFAGGITYARLFW